MLLFNSNGFLQPSSNIRSSLTELKSEFVDKTKEESRKVLYDKYVVYSEALKHLLGNINIVQWIDGSFVTKKKNPSDFDIVTFVDASLLKLVGDQIDNFKYPSSIEKFGIDAYLVKSYNLSDSNHSLFIGDKMYWFDAFSRTRGNRSGRSYPKGFLEIIY